MTPDEFRVFGHALVDWIAEYRSSLPQLRVMSDCKPGEIRALLPPEPPSEPEPVESLFADLRRVILPGITHWSHPRFFAYFPANSSLPAVLADLVASGLGAQCMSWQTSPAATELEEVMMDWLRQMVGLPQNFVGALQDTASTATLVALICARERAGKLSSTRPMTVYASEQANSSVEKGVRLAGFGPTNLQLIETDREFALVPHKLEEAISADVAAGKWPAAVVATVGTTARWRWTQCMPSPKSPPIIGCGCTSTRRWLEARCCCRNAGRCGEGWSKPTRWFSILTSGWVPPSIALRITSGIPRNWFK